MLKTSYFILGIKNTATEKTVKSTYRKLAHQFHPDRNPQNPLALENFKLIQRAYLVAKLDAKERAETASALMVMPTVNNKVTLKPQTEVKPNQICRRNRRGTRSQRRFNWQLNDEYIGTQVTYTV